jgi:hypothetical protein
MEIQEKETNSGSQGNIQVETREISPQGRYIRVLFFVCFFSFLIIIALVGR